MGTDNIILQNAFNECIQKYNRMYYQKVQYLLGLGHWLRTYYITSYVQCQTVSINYQKELNNLLE